MYRNHPQKSDSYSLLNGYVLFTSYRKIKVWDLAAALDPRAPGGTLCLRTLVVST